MKKSREIHRSPEITLFWIVKMKDLIEVIKNIIKVKILRQRIVYYTDGAKVLDDGNVVSVRHEHVLGEK